MALPLAEAFTARSLGVMWDNYKKTLGTAPYLGRQKFGTRKQDSLDLRFIKGKNGLPVSLKASNFDAQAELRDVGGFSDIQNSMPFYREGYMVTEKEEQEYDNYRTSENSSLANNVLREISKKPMMLIEGALVVPERQIWQLLAPTDGVPKVKVVLGDKNYVVDYTADNGAEHKEKHFKSITGTSAWDKPTTCAPLDDLITACRDFAKATGYSLTRFTMNTETWEWCLRQRTQRNRYSVSLLTMAVLDYSKDRLLNTLEDMVSRLKYTISSMLTSQDRHSTLCQQVLYLHSLPEYSLAITHSARHQRKEAEVSQTEASHLLRPVYLYTHMLQIILSILTVSYL